MHAQRTFLYISLPLFCTTTTWNFLVTFYGGNVVCAHQKKCCLRSCSHTYFNFAPPLAFLIFSPQPINVLNFFFIQRNSSPLVFYLSLWLFLCYPRRADVRWRNNQIFCLIDGFPISIAMGLRRERSLLQDFVSYTKIQPKFKQMFMSNKLNCFKQADFFKKFPWVTYLKTSSPWDNIHVLTRQNWQMLTK